MTQLPKTCVFCGNSPLTKEHALPRWLKQIFPRSAADKHGYHHLIYPIPGSPYLEPISRNKVSQGHVGGRQLRIVCGRCNNGWMSEIDNDAKSALVPLINGHVGAISTGDQRAVANWAVKAAMINEYADLGMQSVTQRERDWLRLNLLPPPMWHVWISAYAGFKWRELKLTHQTFRINPDDSPTPDGHTAYALGTAIGLGHVFVYIIGTSWDKLHRRLADRVPYLGQVSIWPSRGTRLSWPPDYVFSEIQADRTASILGHMVADLI